MKTVQWNSEKRDRLTLALHDAKASGKDTFMFDGDEYVVGYAKYLLQYLNERLGN